MADDEKKKVEMSVEEITDLVSQTVREVVESAKYDKPNEFVLANQPFKKRTAEEKIQAERFGKLVSRPKSKTEAQKSMVFFKTGTFLDKLFLTEKDKIAEGIPIVVQMGIVGLPDVGKSVLVQEIALRCASEGKRVVFVTSEDAWESPSPRFDLQSRMKQKADKMGLDWEDLRYNLFVFDTITNSQLRDWNIFVEQYRYLVEILKRVDLLIIDSMTLMDTYRGALKNRLMTLASYNQTHGITAIYVSQRAIEEADKYAIAGGIGLAHNLDATICIDFKKAVGQLKADLNKTRPKDNQIKQWDLVHFVRMLGCRLCGFDRKYYEVSISNDGFLTIVGQHTQPL